MAAAPHRVAPVRRDPDRPSDAVLDTTPGLTALLDHLAEELAREYVRLMEQAAQDDPAPISPVREA